MNTDRDREIRGLQTALAGVHTAIWGYGRLTPELLPELDAQARSAYHDYRRLRSRLGSMLADRDAEPVASLPAYRLPHPVNDSDSARELAAKLERGCAEAFGTLVEYASGPDLRRYAANELLACAKRERDWGGKPGAFPGAKPNRTSG